jgi:hypothetical protein
MNAPFTDHGPVANQQALAAWLAELRAGLEGVAAARSDPRERVPSLTRLATGFGLSRFEAETLLLCAGFELDAAIAPLCGRLHHDAARGWPSFGLALSVLSEPHWSAIAPSAPLRHHCLAHVDDAAGLTAGRLRIAEPVLHVLVGLDEVEPELRAVLRSPPPPAPLAASHDLIARLLAELCSDATPAPEAAPICELAGKDSVAIGAIMRDACLHAGLRPFVVGFDDVKRLAEGPGLRAVERDLRLAGAVLLIEADEEPEPAVALADRLDTAVFVSTRRPAQFGTRRRALRRFAIGRPPPGEERRVWLGALAGYPLSEREIDRITGDFRLPSSRAAAVRRRLPADSPANAADNLARACRDEAVTNFGKLAEPIVPASRWNDLVLPEASLGLIEALIDQVRHRGTVHDNWGFRSRSARGLGISALFSGPSGTGKTMAAEVIAGELGLDLFRIDLSQVVSKWLGEAEKNISQVFDAAEGSGAILLFDEADALFGKRSEVRDSHDRYANVEISHLLQRMETYGGLALLTSNNEDALDTAFQRRLRFIVQFPFPDVAQRTEIWKRIFPSATPTAVLDFDKLARLSAAGGTIRNIALTAAFLAAAEDQPVGMRQLKTAAEMEWSKLKRPMSMRETKDWV